ncbi:MAG: hypothetical protein IJ008_02455 [Clostridia bacterium]|nr:hypothetical protein [Clostridia bacterium]
MSNTRILKDLHGEKKFLKLMTLVKEHTYKSLVTNYDIVPDVKKIILDRNQVNEGYINYIVNTRLKEGYSPYDLLVVFPSKKYDFDDLNYVIGLHNKLAEKGIASCFEHSTIEEALKYNKEASELVNKINNTKVDGENLSPFEKFTLLYNFVADRFYIEDESDIYHSRNAISTYTGDKMVCVGFSELLSQLCKECGINCQTQLLNTDSSVNYNNHQNNIVYIDDPKYNIKGVFMCDACWDCKTQKKTQPSFNFFMIPLEDLKHTNGRKVFNLNEVNPRIEELKKGVINISSNSPIYRLLKPQIDQLYKDYTISLRETEYEAKQSLEIDNNFVDKNLEYILAQECEEFKALGFDIDQRCSYNGSEKLIYKYFNEFYKRNLYDDEEFLNNFKNELNKNIASENEVETYSLRELIFFHSDIIAKSRKAYIRESNKQSLAEESNARKLDYSKKVQKVISDAYESIQNPSNLDYDRMMECLEVVAKAKNQIFGTNQTPHDLLESTIESTLPKNSYERNDIRKFHSHFTLSEANGWFYKRVYEEYQSRVTTLRLPLPKEQREKLSEELSNNSFNKLNKKLNLENDFFIITITAEDLALNMDFIKGRVKKAINSGVSPSKIICKFDTTPILTLKEYKTLLKYQKALFDKYNVNSCYTNSSNKEVESFIQNIDNFVKDLNSRTINGQKLSQLEKYRIIYEKFSNMECDENSENDFISAFKTKKGNSQTLSTLFAFVCQQVGINCHPQKCLNNTEDTDKIDNYYANVVSLNDSKYGIKNQIFYSLPFDIKKFDIQKSFLSSQESHQNYDVKEVAEDYMYQKYHEITSKNIEQYFKTRNPQDMNVIENIVMFNIIENQSKLYRKIRKLKGNPDCDKDTLKELEGKLFENEEQYLREFMRQAKHIPNLESFEMTDEILSNLKDNLHNVKNNNNNKIKEIK